MIAPAAAVVVEQTMGPKRLRSAHHPLSAEEALESFAVHDIIGRRAKHSGRGGRGWGTPHHVCRTCSCVAYTPIVPLCDMTPCNTSSRIFRRHVI